MPTTIPTELIERALALTWKIQADMHECVWNAYTDKKWLTTYEYAFSIEKFCYYLLSPSFIEKYYDWDNQELQDVIIKDFGRAIYEYQYWDAYLLISLLEKIPWQQ